ncbi:inactive ribonuclease-like protein 9 [Acomys russatus]|uniref:inactive ribonuclease-like protein 9 n=1 Tax=Acomys russatus TaxID=60746 RepID=UPI0021E2B741|nr:inactive ribonuclease-like protein 9 [Acomys russatus]
MKSLATTYPWPWPLLLLLLLPLPPKLQGDYWDFNEYEVDPELRDYLRELESTGPTRPPSRERIVERIIADTERPLGDEEYCNYEMKFKQIHYKLLCYPEHYFLAATVSQLQNACRGKRVPCKNGALFCRRSMSVLDGVRCVLESGEKIAQCTYKSIFTRGYAVITCHWDDDIEEFIPDSVLDILPPE